MQSKFRKTFLSVSLALAVCLSLTNFHVALADDATPTDPPPVQTTDAATQSPASNPTVAPDSSTPATDVATDPSALVTDPPVDSTPVQQDNSPTPAPSDLTATDQPPTDPAATDQAPTDQVSGTAPAPGDQGTASNTPTPEPTTTEVVVLDANGTPVPLATQQAADIVASTDPMWCPAGVLPGGAGCTINFASVSLLQNNINNNAGNYAQDGIIYFTSSATNSFTLNTGSIGTGDFNTIKSFSLTLQGGWDGSNGASTFTGQTDFSTNSVTLGSSTTPWGGNVTLSNLTFNNASSTPISVFTTAGNIVLDNIDVSNQAHNANTAVLQSTSGNITIQNGSSFDGNNTGGNQSNGLTASTGGTGSISISDTTFQDSRKNGSHANGATLSAPTITLTNVTANNNDKSGIAASNYSLLTLNNVTANGNGTGNATLAGNVGSGITATGTAGSRVIVIGGAFDNNARYGIEDTNSTVYIQSNPTCTGNVGGCYNVTAIFDSTPPTITPNITGTLGSNDWYTSNVTLTWSIADPESGILSSSGCTSATLTSETLGTVITCSATNNAGLSNSASITIKIDKTAPSIAYVSRTPANANGWNNGDVTVNWSCTDVGSGAVSASVSQTVIGEGLGQSAIGICTDLAGNTASDVQTGINIDKTNPVLSLPADITADAAGPSGATISYLASVSDNLDSGVSLVCTPASGSLFPIANTSVNCSATDQADNAATGIFHVAVGDTTPPVIAAHGNVSETTNQYYRCYYFIRYPVTTDAVDGSGVANCSPASGSHFNVGDYAGDLPCADSHGNAAITGYFFGAFGYQEPSGPDLQIAEMSPSRLRAAAPWISLVTTRLFTAWRTPQLAFHSTIYATTSR